MSENTVKVKIKQRCDTEANWKASDPVLLDGEMAISSDKDNRYKIGNGTSKWSALSYAKAEPTTHTHNYAGSSSAGGSANTAIKLAAARTVTANGDMTGSFNFDGSGNVTYNLYPYNSTISVGNKNNYPFHRFAYIDVVADSYVDKSSTFLITQDYYGGGFGIVKITLRTNNSSSVSTVSVEWLVRKGFAADSVQAAIYNVFGATYVDAFFKTQGAYASTVVRNMASGTRGALSRTWTLVNSKEVNDTTADDPLTSIESYATIEDAGTTLHEQAYSTTVSGSDSGTVLTANALATSAGSATQPVYFSSGKPVACTYTLGKSVPSNAVFTDTTYTALKNPYALTLQFNGTTNKTYDGSSAQTLNITPSAIGAAASSHTHNYAGSSSSGGSANSAAKSRYLYDDYGKEAGVVTNTSTTAGAFRIATVSGLSTVNFTLGASGTTHRWKQVYATATAISTSDRNQKHSIQELSDKYEQLFLKLLPVSFLYNNGESGRTHIGFISQDVETAMNEVGLTNLDFAGFCRDIDTKTIIDENKKEIDVKQYDEDGNPIYIYSLRYEEFIALNTHMIQKLYNKVDGLESRLASLENNNLS